MTPFRHPPLECRKCYGNRRCEASMLTTSGARARADRRIRPLGSLMWKRITVRESWGRSQLGVRHVFLCFVFFQILFLTSSIFFWCILVR
jgi:hypothetical protein